MQGVQIYHIKFLIFFGIPIKVDVRVIAATHQNLEKLVKEDRFREDLLHRLNVIRVHVPSLRQRKSDGKQSPSNDLTINPPKLKLNPTILPGIDLL